MRNKGKGDAGNEKESESLTRRLKESEGEILNPNELGKYTLLHIGVACGHRIFFDELLKNRRSIHRNRRTITLMPGSITILKLEHYFRHKIIFR